MTDSLGYIIELSPRAFPPATASMPLKAVMPIDTFLSWVRRLFNAEYELLLQMIARYFAFGHETPEQRHVLAHTAVGLMFRGHQAAVPAARGAAGGPKQTWWRQWQPRYAG
jgi:hypothetical protein